MRSKKDLELIWVKLILQMLLYQVQFDLSLLLLSDICKIGRLWMCIILFEIYYKKQDLKRQIVIVNMRDLDFTKGVISLPNWSKLPSCIIQYESIMKNVELMPIFLKYIVRSRIAIWIDRGLELIWVKWILKRLFYPF